MPSDAPLISFIVPTHPEWAPYALRFLRSLALQTCHDFEVVFGVDGGDDGRIGEVVAGHAPGFEPTEEREARGPWPFGVRVVDTPRPHGDFPHRNHARNGAIQASRGAYCWIVDTDFLWVEHAVEHAVAVIESAAERRELVTITPALQRIHLDPELFVAHTEDWAQGEDERSTRDLVGGLDTGNLEWSGHGELYAPSDEPRVVAARVEEGFPLVARSVLDALGGFDEAFTRWGGNKIELCYRLTSLGGVGLPYRLLASVCAWHQPHPQDPNKPRDDPHRRANHGLYLEKTRQVRAEADWWTAQRDAVQKVLVELRAGEHRQPGGDRPPPTVGLLTVGNPLKGIARDVELVEECLAGPRLRRRGVEDVRVLRFTVDNPRAFEEHTGPSLEGQQWSAFCEDIDVLVLSEVLPVPAVNAALAAGVRVVFIPNADWARLGDDDTSDRWIALVRALAQRPGFGVWAKTSSWSAELERHGIPNVEIPWIALDPVVTEPRDAADRPLTFYACLGLGGYKGRRGAAELMEAWRRFGGTDAGARLIVKTARSLPELANPPEGVEVICEDWTRQRLQAQLEDVDVVLYPTKWDGFGLSLSEALNAGRPVLAPNVWPMSDQVTHGHDGLLFECPVAEHPMRLAPVASIDVEALVGAMREVCDPSVRRRLTGPQPGLRRAMQRAMRTVIRSRLVEDTVPSVLVVRSPGAGRGGRRSESYWQAALERCGFRVLSCTHPEVVSLDPGLSVDFVLVGKCDPVVVDQIRGVVGDRAPVICWHHDLTDWSAHRESWQREILPVVDLTLVSEGDLRRFHEGRIDMLYPGHKIALRRPSISDAQAAPGRDFSEVVFLGNCVGYQDERARIIGGLKEAQVAVAVHGEGWQQVGLEGRPPVFDLEAHAAYRGRVALSVSRTPPDGAPREGYTSNRLFNVLASGSCPAVQRFPGVDRLVSPGGAVLFDGPTDLLAQLEELDTDARAQIAARAEEHAWRHHTWEDRVLQILEAHAPARRATKPAPIGGSKFGAMWEGRARNLGPRAVAHIAWDDSKFAAATEQWWKKFKMHFGRRLKPHDRRVLDFGCGVGRFTGRIARDCKREVVGVDISPSMVEMARERNPGIDFRALQPGGVLPFADDTFDVVFTSTVLQHIPDEEFAAACRELKRVLRPGGLVFLFENCHPAKGRASFSGHVVFRQELEYRQQFPGVVDCESWYVEGEKHAILIGRMPA